MRFPRSSSTLLLSGLLLWLLGAAAHAQEVPTTPAPPAPAPPERVTIPDFAIKANEVEDRLATIDSALLATDVADSVIAALTEIEADGAALHERFGTLGTRRMMNSEINSFQTELSFQEARARRQIDKLSSRAAELGGLYDQNEVDIELWTQAVRDSKSRVVPEEVRARAIEILRDLRKVRGGLEKKQNELLSLQSRGVEVLNAIDNAERTIEVAQREQARSVFKRQDPPLWQKPPAEEAERGGDVAKRLGYEVRFSWPAMTAHFRAVRGMLLVQLLVFLALGWLFTRTQSILTARFEKRQQEGPIPWEDRAIEAMRHPWAAALLVGIASTRLFLPERVVDTIILTWVIILPLWFVVYKEMIPAVFQKPLIGLALLGTLHIIFTLLSGHSLVERLVLLLELLLATAAAGWTIRFLKTVDVPKRVRQGLWFSATSLWSRVVVVVAAAGVVATLLGYTYLGGEAAFVATLGTIGATAWMALARIIEASLSTSIHIGRLDGFRMIRANRDVTSKWLTRGVRIVAVAFFVYVMADQTSAWRPIADAIRRGLSTDLGLGLVQTGVSFLDVLGFFFVLWLSWLLSQLLSFVLQEEVLLRLDMQPGVPYAIKTFTRYVIIAVGFLAAFSVLGIPLDRVTIMLSALGVGIGFGLQGLVNNVVSGFILLTERPIRLHDKVEIEGVLGNVSSIGMRASTIRTFDGAEVIVPNGDLTSQRVVNWTLAARQQRVTIPVGVAYGTDPNEVLKILRKVADDDDKVFQAPAPLALFRGFGESSLDFELRIFMDPSDVLAVPSAVTIAINDALKEANIEIPFPQRDLHLRGVPDGFQFADVTAEADADADADAKG